MGDHEPGPSRRNVVYRHVRLQIGPNKTTARQNEYNTASPEHTVVEDDEPPILSHFSDVEPCEEIAGYVGDVHAGEEEDGIEIVDEVVHAGQSYDYEDMGDEDEDASVMAIEQKNDYALRTRDISTIAQSVGDLIAKKKGLLLPNKLSNSLRIANAGKRTFKDPRKTYPRCYVEPSRRWTYKSESQPILNDGELYYAPDPFRPVPPTKNGPCAAIRMHYAAQRIDNVKYRNQQAVANAAKRGNMESASCEKCNMRYFLPYSDMRARISYSENTRNRYNLPTAFFRCPICGHQNQIIECA